MDVRPEFLQPWPARIWCGVEIGLGAVEHVLIVSDRGRSQGPVERGFQRVDGQEARGYGAPGASGNLLRSLAYFPDASTTRPWLALAGSAVVGVALSLIGRHRDEEVVHLEGMVEPDPA